jgi:aryl-alcohol dehydrogenase-like predicted oxidoreductase
LSDLGRTMDGTQVGRLGLGCFFYGLPDRAQSIRTIQRAIDLGVNLLDTSDAYGAGENEQMVGEAIAGRRQRVYLTTKFGWVLDASGKPTHLDGSPAHVRQSCEASLRRLGTDYIDLYVAHRIDPNVRIEETVGEIKRLVKEGKVRAYGLSEAGVSTITRAQQVSPVAALQTEYSLWSRDPEVELLPLCARLGIAFVAYSPLGRGFLAGAVRNEADLRPDDFRRTHPRFQGANLDHNRELIAGLTQLAGQLGRTPAQLALAWLLSRPGNVYAIPATRSEAHLEDNLAASQMTLSAPQLDAIGSIVSPKHVHGARHPAEHMKTIGR